MMPFPQPTGRDYYDSDDDAEADVGCGVFLLGLAIALVVGLAHWALK